MWGQMLPDLGGQHLRMAWPSVALANGAALLIAVTDHLVLTLVEADGTTRWSRDYPDTEVSAITLPEGDGGALLTPDGTLYVLMRREGASDAHYLMAIEIGDVPADIVVSTGRGGLGLNWARTSAPLAP